MPATKCQRSSSSIDMPVPKRFSNFVHCARILGDACESSRITASTASSSTSSRSTSTCTVWLRLVSALSPVIGYDRASSIVHDADRSGRSLREAALDCGAISAEDFDQIINPANMVGPF